MKTLLKIDIDSRGISECTCAIECEKDEMKKTCELAQMSAIAKLNNKCKS